jgi:hypothetical protein
VKPTLALALLAVLGFTAAGCGATKKKIVVVQGGSVAMTRSPGHAIRVSGSTTTIPNVKEGTWIACKSLPRLRLTAPTTGTNVTGRSNGKEIRLKRLPNGSIRVSCPTH